MEDTKPNFNETIKKFKNQNKSVLFNQTFTFKQSDTKTLYYDSHNPFEKFAGVFYVLGGCSDPYFMMNYNDKVEVDDISELNAPLGERIRCFNKNDYQEFILNPIDQLNDAFLKLKDGGIATIQLYNQLFDNMKFNGGQPKDITFSLYITEDDKLNGSLVSAEAELKDVFFSKREIFTSIIKLLASWLNIGVGDYTHTILKLSNHSGELKEFIFKDMIPLEFSTPLTEFDDFMYVFIDKLIVNMHDENSFLENSRKILAVIECIPDEYFKNAGLSLYAYRAFKLGEFTSMSKALDGMMGTHRIECLHFLYPFLKNEQEYKELYSFYDENVTRYIEHKIQRHY